MIRWPFHLDKWSGDLEPFGIRPTWVCLLDWSTWRRLPKMRLIDAAAFLTTAVSVLVVNAVAAVALGSSLYALRYMYLRAKTPASRTAVTPA